MHGRSAQIKFAEAAGREVVSVFGESKQGDAIGGIVGRLGEALVIADVVDAATIAPLTQPWLEVIGPLEGEPRIGP
jgi:hypothetical protein